MKIALLSGWLLLQLFTSGILTEPQYTCKNDLRYLVLNICIVENVNPDAFADLADMSLPNATQLEFRNAHFRTFGVEMFQLLGDTERVSFRNGFVREVLFWSQSVEVLRVINTDLTVLDVLGEPNDSLKQLTIRSPVYSNWMPDMRLLRALEVIDVAYCNFSYLNLDWFGGFRYLRMLDVSYNRLHAIRSGPFLTLQALQELYVAGNQLEYLWRFPDLFPKLSFINLSDNRWFCEWVTMARDAIWIMRIVSMGSDFNCDEGWSNNGGLCCRRTGVSWDGHRKPEKGNGLKRTSNVPVMAVLDIMLEEARNGTQNMAIGVELGDSVVFVDKPIPV